MVYDIISKDELQGPRNRDRISRSWIKKQMSRHERREGKQEQREMVEEASLIQADLNVLENFFSGDDYLDAPISYSSLDDLFFDDEDSYEEEFFFEDYAA
jgi:hypothetical protein